jgi:hypothetical protein
MAAKLCREFSRTTQVMTKGVSEISGYDVVVDGLIRTFSGTEDGAMEAAREIKRVNSNSRVQIRMRRTGAMCEILEDGRIK